VLFAALTAPTLALGAVGVAGLVGIGLYYLLSGRRRSAPEPPPPAGTAAKLENYQLILDTLERSNVLLWWGRVTREGSTYNWKIRTPPQLRDNPIYRLADLTEKDWLWDDNQSPDHERLDRTSRKALSEGASGYQQEFPIIGLDGTHWLSEEVVIRPEGPNSWNLAGVIVDITKRHEAEDKFRAIFENAREGIVLTETDGTIVAANPSLARIFGYESADSFMREMPSIAGCYASATTRSEIMRQLRESGRISDFEVQMRRKDGTLIWTRINIQVVKDKRGTEHYEGTVEDVTENRRAQEALAENERKYRELVENANSVILRWTRGGVITFLNEFGQKFFGFTDAEIQGRHMVGTIISPESETTGRDLGQLMSQIGTSPEMFAQTVFEHTRRNGEKVWVAWTNKPVLDEHGQTNEILSIGSDITGRRRVEEALKREEALFADLANTIPDHIYFKDRQSRFIRINEAMARSFELRSAAEAVGKTDFDIFGAEHAQQAFADEQRIMETGKPLIGVEEKETWPDGHVTWVSTTKMPVRDAQGRITGMVGISRDVTEHKLAEAQVREQNEILSKSHEGVMIVNLDNKIDALEPRGRGDLRLVRRRGGRPTARGVVSTRGPGDRVGAAHSRRARRFLERRNEGEGSKGPQPRRGQPRHACTGRGGPAPRPPELPRRHYGEEAARGEIPPRAAAREHRHASRGHRARSQQRPRPDHVCRAAAAREPVDPARLEDPRHARSSAPRAASALFGRFSDSCTPPPASSSPRR
jgi:PAS domain S-box-containing protein